MLAFSVSNAENSAINLPAKHWILAYEWDRLWQETNT